MGDLLLATVFPLVMCKVFGRAAGWAALVLGFAVISSLLLLPRLTQPGMYFPVMVVLGPLMALHYVYWHYRRGRERTTQLYLKAEPLAGK